MHSIQLYIEEELDVSHILKLKHLIKDIPHVTEVEISSKAPHNAVVDYEEHATLPMQIVEVLKQNGIHPDIVGA